MSPMQRCFSDLVCQPLVTSYVIDAYLCNSVWHVARLDHRVPAHDALRLTVDIRTKAERQWPDGEDHLATSSSTGLMRMPAFYCSYLCCGDLSLPGATERRNGSFGLYATTTMMTKDDL